MRNVAAQANANFFGKQHFENSRWQNQSCKTLCRSLQLFLLIADFNVRYLQWRRKMPSVTCTSARMRCRSRCWWLIVVKLFCGENVKSNSSRLWVVPLSLENILVTGNTKPYKHGPVRRGKGSHKDSLSATFHPTAIGCERTMIGILLQMNTSLLRNRLWQSNTTVYS